MSGGAAPCLQQKIDDPQIFISHIPFFKNNIFLFFQFSKCFILVKSMNKKCDYLRFLNLTGKMNVMKSDDALFVTLIIILWIMMIGPVAAEIPFVDIAWKNSDEIGLYEKFEIILDLDNASYENPYDPEQIDIRAELTAPSGKIWRVFGFYDDYHSADSWKIRFAPDETGIWQYRVTASGPDGIGESPLYTFEAVESGHPGWIHVSDENPHYLMHDKGTQFYGVGAYMPWGNTLSRFDRLADYHGNFFAIWNILSFYGGMINSKGLIEESLGEYNQNKCGMIDSLIQISEARGLHIQYCIWPHDLFSETVWDAAQWSYNPYQEICDVEYVYSDSLCWEYQKRLYRYMIARFAYSRSWVVWEIINEMNGTDGWAKGFTDACYTWVSKVDAYFKTNDPYRHPTTASFSGGYGEYRPELYWRCDLPNIHIYESQGWPTRFSDNPLRSSLYNYADASLRFWENYDQPAQFGEAGHTLTYYQPGEPEYTDLVHNAVWGSFMNGLSITPVWWTLSDLSDDELAHFSPFREFVDSIDLLHVSRIPFRDSTIDLDIMGMKTDSSAFGWIRDIPGNNVSGKTLRLSGLFDASYANFAMMTYNPWTGTVIDTQFIPQVEGILIQHLPVLDNPVPDVAFLLWPAEAGETPVRIQLTAFVEELLSVNRDSSDLFCTVLDAQGRLCPQALDITFQIRGAGIILGEQIQTTNQGVIHTYFQPSEGSGLFQIIGESEGLISDTLEVNVVNSLPIDDFESYQSDTELQNQWISQFNTIVLPHIENEVVFQGAQSLRLDYTIGVNSPPYAFIKTDFKKRDMIYIQALGFWLVPDGSNRDLEVRLQTETRNYMKYNVSLNGTNKKYVLIPLEDFNLQSGVETIDFNILTELQFKIKRGGGEYGISTIVIDDIDFLMDTTMHSLINPNKNHGPEQFQLFQNYPNPFNPETTIQYTLDESGPVELCVYNLTGQAVSTLVQSEQEAGEYHVSWDASQLSSGIYFYCLKAEDRVRIEKCLLIK